MIKIGYTLLLVNNLYVQATEAFSLVGQEVALNNSDVEDPSAQWFIKEITKSGFTLVNKAKDEIFNMNMSADFELLNNSFGLQLDGQTLKVMLSDIRSIFDENFQKIYPEVTNSFTERFYAY